MPTDSALYFVRNRLFLFGRNEVDRLFFTRTVPRHLLKATYLLTIYQMMTLPKIPPIRTYLNFQNNCF